MDLIAWLAHKDILGLSDPIRHQTTLTAKKQQHRNQTEICQEGDQDKFYATKLKIPLKLGVYICTCIFKKMVLFSTTPKLNTITNYYELDNRPPNFGLIFTN